MNRLRLEFAAEAFLNSMRSSWMKRNPATPAPAFDMASYSPVDRSVLMKAVGEAIRVSSPAHDDAFDKWRERRESEAETIQ